MPAEVPYPMEQPEEGLSKLPNDAVSFGNAPEPIPIGQRLHQDARDGFVPKTPENAQFLNAPLKPISQHQGLEENVSLTPDKTNASTSQEQHITHLEPKPNLKVRLGLAAVGLLGTLGIGGYFANKELNNDSGSGGSVPAVVGPSTPTPSPTEVSTVTSTATNTPEATKTPEIAAPTYGKYKDLTDFLEHSKVPDSVKKNIELLTKDCIPQIITDEGMLCIDKALMTRPKTLNHYGAQLSVGQFHSAALNTQQFPNATSMFNRGLDDAKYNAWVTLNNIQNVTFNQYMQDKGKVDHSFAVWSYVGTSNTVAWQTTKDTDFVIVNYAANYDRTNLIDNQALEYDREVLPGVVKLDIAVSDVTGIGVKDGTGVIREPYITAEWGIAGLGSFSVDVPKSVASGKYSLAYQRSQLIDTEKKIITDWIPAFNSNATTTANFVSIFTVTGTSINP